jgi:hypothetical protein
VTLDDAIAIYAKRSLDREERTALCREAAADPADALDALALAVAQRYMKGHLGFEIADAVMNDLFAHSCELREIPKLMYSIYEVFDDGEYLHREDPPGTDPEAKYTRPQLARILDAAGAA